MKMPQHYGFSWKVALVVLGYSVVLPPGWAQAQRTKSVPSELALNVSSKDPGIPVRAIEPNFALIEKVQAIDLGQHVQVRVVGNGALSCRPFLLAAPDRLVLDCPGAHVRAGSTPTRVNLDPVLSVRVGQFKTNVARVVVELAGQAPYTVDADGTGQVARREEHGASFGRFCSCRGITPIPAGINASSGTTGPRGGE